MDYLEKIRQSVIDNMRAAEQRGTVNNTLDFLKGAGRAYSADIAGTPVDLRNMVSSALSPEGGGNPYAQGIRNLIGRPDDKYGSDYFADTMGIGGEGLAYNAGNMIGPEGIKSLFKNALSPNVRKIFAGEKAANAPLKDLDTAKEMTKSGADPRQIWKDTGWFQGRDGNWRWEIDDSSFVPPTGTETLKTSIKDMFTGPFYGNTPVNHKELLINYPNRPTGSFLESLSDFFNGKPKNQIANANIALFPVKKTNKSKASGSYQPESNLVRVSQYKNNDDLKSILTHELQHNVQNIEGFTPNKKYLDPFVEEYQKYANQLMEVEARAAQKRMGYTPQQRRDIFPEDDYDVHPEDVTFFAGGLASLKRRK